MNETDTSLFDPATNSSSSTSNNNSPTITINGQEYSARCIAYLQSILSTDELSSAIVHCSTSAENEAFDSWGLQGGQFWTDPTPPPSKPPSIKPTSLSSQPTASPLPPPSSSPSLSPSLSYPPSGGEPTYHPTLHNKLFVLRGTIYYDRNANGSRDVNVATDEFGPDTEYNVGLGGVNLRLVECDLDTNEAVAEMVSGDKKQQQQQQGDDGEEEGESGWNSYSSTISQGYDVLFRPVLADRGVDGGKYNMINIKVNRAYYIEAEAPVGFLFTGGVCNNAVPGWTCPKPTTAGSFSAVGGGTSTNMKSLNAEQRESFSEKFLKNEGEDALGLRVGRSTRCVSVDRTGKVDGNLDLGVMRSGDVKLDKTEVRMTLDLGDVENSIKEMHIKDDNKEGGNRRLSILQRLLSVFSNNKNYQSLQDRILRGATHLGNNRYLLQDSDQYAIGVVTSEVLASSLDVALAANGVELDHIMHKDVILSLESSQASEFVADGEEAFEESNSASSSSSSSSSAGDGASASDLHNKSEGLRRNLATNDNSNNDNSNTRPNNNNSNNDNSSTRPNNSQPTYNSRNPAPRRQNRLTVDLEVWGHYPPQLNVDFDYIVQDSINAQTDAIRAELVDYNANCEDQTELVADHGYVMDDFEEIYSNKGVTSNTRMKRERNAARQQQGEDSSTTLDDAVMAASEEVESKVFRTACSNEIKLPEYFEESLKTIEATKVEAVTILEEPSATPFTMIGILAALMVVMLVGAFFVFRMGFKKKSTDEEDDLDDYSYDEEDTKYGSQSYASQSYASKSKCDISESDRKCKAKMESYRSGGPFDAPAPIPVRPPSNFISAAVSQVGEGIASRFKFGGRSKLDKSQTSSEKHEAYARKVSTNAPVEKMTLDESESIVDPTKVLDDDQIAADDRLKDFERRMRTMKQSAVIQKKLEAQDFDQSTVSTRPNVPVDIKFAAAQLASKNSGSTGKGSSDDDESSSSSSSASSSSSSDSSAPVKKRKKKVVANKKNGKVSRRVT